MQIRAETEADWPAIRALNEAAFAAPAEATLVALLRKQAQPLISLVAEDEGKILGHIMFSPVVLSGHNELKIMGLAPLAVIPEHQGEGIGSELVRAGLDQCKQLDCGAVVVLGHPTYYPRFGFVPAVRFGISCEYDGSEEAFMLIELQSGYLNKLSGTIRYHPAFKVV